MKLKSFLPMVVVMLLVGLSPSARPESEKQEVKEKSLDAPNSFAN